MKLLEHIPELVLSGALLIFSVLYIIWLSHLADYSAERRTYELYQNASCLIKDHVFVSYATPECGDIYDNVSSSSIQSACYKYVLSYAIFNGTIINSAIIDKDYSRKVGSYHQCLYEKKRVTSVFWEISDGKLTQKKLFIYGFVGYGILAIALALVICLCLAVICCGNSQNAPEPTQKKTETFLSNEENTQEATSC